MYYMHGKECVPDIGLVLPSIAVVHVTGKPEVRYFANLLSTSAYNLVSANNIGTTFKFVNRRKEHTLGTETTRFNRKCEVRREISADKGTVPVPSTAARCALQGPGAPSCCRRCTASQTRSARRR